MSYFSPKDEPKDVIHVKSKIKDESENQASCSDKTRCGRKFPTPYVSMNDSILIRECDNTILINWKVANIKKYEIIRSQMVKAYFYDGEPTAVALSSTDIYPINNALRRCIALHVGSSYYNDKGIDHLAERLSYLKCIDQMLESLHESYEEITEEPNDSSVFGTVPSDIHNVNYELCGTTIDSDAHESVDENCSLDSNLEESRELNDTDSSNPVKSRFVQRKPLTIRRRPRRQFKKNKPQ